MTFAGRNVTHNGYGILVSIEAKGSKYVSLSAHLNSLASGIKRGAEVARHTVIGFAGNTGGGDIPLGRPHLHQAYYRVPQLQPGRLAVRGRGAVGHTRLHYFRGDDGVYGFGWTKEPAIRAKGSLISF